MLLRAGGMYRARVLPWHCKNFAVRHCSASLLSKPEVSDLLTFNHSSTPSCTSDAVDINGNTMCLRDLSRLASGTKCSISKETMQRLQASRDVVTRIVASQKPTYGINTGFGLLSTSHIASSELAQLQENIIRSHASGIGEPLAPELVRRIMALRINTLAKGRSGISLSTFNNLVKLFNSGCTPYVPSQGTVGASGDLAPLAHIGLALIGDGLIYDPKKGQYCAAKEVLADYNIPVTQLQAKDGLSLVNGTQFITGIGSRALEVAIQSFQTAQPIAALTLTSLCGFSAAMDERVHNSRPHIGQRTVAEIMRNLLPTGTFTSTTTDVQDPYSLRCVPQVHGPVLDALLWINSTLQTEMNSSTDNPLVFTEGENNIISAGNFHGEYPAKALDSLALYVGEIGRISTSRIMLLVDPKRNRDLPAFLAANPGVNSGFMTWELTAAALDAENRTLSTPASAETAITSAGKEDHVSMGGFSARKALQVVENVQKILAIELMLATHAIHWRKAKDENFKIPPLLQPIYEHCRGISPPVTRDKYWKPEYDQILNYLQNDLCKEASAVFGDVGRHFGSRVTHCDTSTVSPVKCSDNLYMRRPADKIKELLSRRPMQQNIGELPSFTYDRSFTSMEDLRLTIAERSKQCCILMILDVAEGDFGSRANYGRGNDEDALARGCPSSYDVFVKRLMNTAINELNSSFASSLFLLGSMNFADLTNSCKDKKASIPSERKELIDAVITQDQRTRAIIGTAMKSSPHNRLYVTNGDHNHMTSVIGGVYDAVAAPVVVVYIDLHADARPVSDGPHSGTWMCEAYDNKWVAGAYCIGLSPLANTESTLRNMDNMGVQYREWTWDKIKSGNKNWSTITESVIADIHNRHGADVNVVFSICGDTVLGLPASAGTGTIGYAPDDMYPFISALCKRCNVKAFTIAEFKTSLEPHKAALVGEFLTQSLFLFHQYSPLNE